MPVKQFNGWSYNRLAKFESCPHMFFREDVAKDVHVAPSDAMQHGLSTHNAMERRLKHGHPLPAGMRRHEPKLKAIENRPGEIFVEDKLAITEDMEECGYFHKTTWLRVVADVRIVNGPKMVVLDWKTGKYKPDDTEQMRISASAFISAKPDIEQVTASYIWLDHPDRKPTTIRVCPDDAEACWDEYRPRVESLKEHWATNSWPKRPSWKCRWCAVKDCEHNNAR